VGLRGCGTPDVHTARGRFDIDLSLAAIEASLGGEFLRVHRQWLVHTAHVRAIENEDGETVVVVGDEPLRELRIPVARERRGAVRDLLLHGATGLRRP
jgi:DNA-binding LytR/AlgR family response regulator